MFKSTQDLQEFISWAKQQRIELVKIGDVEVRFSTLAFIDLETGALNQDSELATKPAKTEERNTSKTLVDTLENVEEEDEELLTWSSRP